MTDSANFRDKLREHLEVGSGAVDPRPPEPSQESEDPITAPDDPRDRRGLKG